MLKLQLKYIKSAAVGINKLKNNKKSRKIIKVTQ